ncbi:MAG TPA: branched-chain amino acid ABC transporter permease [Burkholderiales bacterium]|nr:branched-chain amino acid ABC transporter permease [Burkholderiales bacterium]
MVGWIDTVIQGVLLGGLYALFAMGLSLVYGVMRLVNIAHGDFILLAAYVALVFQGAGLDVAAATPLVVAVMFLGGYVLQRGILNRTLGKGLLPPLLVTFGLSVVIQNVLLQIFSADSQALRAEALTTASLRLGDAIAIGWLPLGVFLVALALGFGLQWLFARTGFGRALRATSDDQETAQLMGIDHRHMYALATALAFALMALAGVFAGMRTSFTPTDGPANLLFAFEAVVIGGLGSFWGTFAGATLLGIAQSIGFRLNPGWGLLVGHLAFLAVLVLRPEGLFPRTR